jgi:hypothetical protein
MPHDCVTAFALAPERREVDCHDTADSRKEDGAGRPTQSRDSPKENMSSARDETHAWDDVQARRPRAGSHSLALGNPEARSPSIV